MITGGCIDLDSLRIIIETDMHLASCSETFFMVHIFSSDGRRFITAV